MHGVSIRLALLLLLAGSAACGSHPTTVPEHGRTDAAPVASSNGAAVADSTGQRGGHGYGSGNERHRSSRTPRAAARLVRSARA